MDLKKSFRIIIKSLFSLIIISFLVYLLFGAPAFLKICKEKFFPGGQVDKQKEQIADDIKEDKTITEENKEKAGLKNNWFYYPKLGIKAPILWDVSLDEINQKMLNGIAHIKDTARPGGGGDIILSGHSSYYFWIKGNYKTVLAPIVYAKKGDDILIVKDELYLYEVNNVRQIKKDEELEFIAGGNREEKLTIMTCVPVGTDLNRLLVEAKLIKKE